MLNTPPARLGEDEATARGDRLRIFAFRAVAALISVGIYALLVVRPVLTSQPGPLRSLRTAYWYDQLGYLSIVSDAAAGQLGAVEPMTLTGVNHYPRSYYLLVGQIARVLGIEPATAWNLTSIVLQFAAVIVLSVVLAALSRRLWLGALAPAPFLTGTLSVVTNGGAWFRSLDSHAVLWGPYGALFSNNAETSALCLIVIVLAVLAAVWLRPVGRRWRVGASVGGAIVLGLLSGFQTYSFLTGIYVVAAVIAAIALSRSRWWWTAVSALGIVVVLLAGPLVAQLGGQLATLVFGLLPLVPGLLRGIWLSRGAFLAYGALTASAAAPPILWTVSGVLGGDPFLSYRTGSNVGLGVIHGGTLIASAPMVLVYAALIWASLRARDRTAAAALIGTAVIAAYLSINDLWGANAEPYRFWTNCLFIGGAVAVIVLARLIARSPSSHRPPGPSEAPRARRRPVALLALAATACVLYTASLADVVAFANDDRMSATWNPDAPRERAIAAAAEVTLGSTSLVVTDQCVDPSTTKVLAPAAIAHYYLGMAWPAAVDEVTALMAARAAGMIDAGVVRAAGAGWLISDSDCATPLVLEELEASPVGSFDYGDGSITVSRITEG